MPFQGCEVAPMVAKDTTKLRLTAQVYVNVEVSKEFESIYYASCMLQLGEWSLEKS